MAEALPSPPPLRSATPESQHKSEDLAAKLDGLLEQYLELLDQYTTLREELSNTFSAGFFSLAQAQRTSTLGAGRRYGQDCYDQRMKAHRQVVISSNEKDHSTVYNIVADIPSQGSVFSANDEKESVDIDVKPESQNVERSSEQNEKEQKTVSKVDSKQSPTHRDPITWFGILVPPALRRTQSLFIAATEHIIPKLLTIQSRMETAETSIEALRAQLPSPAENEGMEDELSEQTEQNREQLSDMSVIQEQRRPDSQRKLASRPEHSKAPLLQLNR